MTLKEYKLAISAVLKMRCAADEMEWALNQANGANNDRNPNRAAQVNAAIQYGLAVAIAARSDDELPPRPKVNKHGFINAV